MASSHLTIAQGNQAAAACLPQFNTSMVEKTSFSLGMDRHSNDEVFPFSPTGVESEPHIDTSIFTSMANDSFNELLQQCEEPMMETPSLYESSPQKDALTIMPLQDEQIDVDNYVVSNNPNLLPDWPMCSCALDVIRDEVPVEQVFIREGQMYRLPEACVICLGNFEIYGFHRRGQWYISLAVFFNIVGLEAMKVYEKVIIGASDLDIMAVGSNELELLIQKNVISPETTVKDLISIECLQRMSRVICETVDLPVVPIVSDIAYGVVYKKVLGNSTRCSNCGLIIKKEQTLVEYEVISKQEHKREGTADDEKVPVTVGVLTACQKKFNAFQMNDNVYISFRDLISQRMFTLPNLRRRLISLDVNPVKAPSEVEDVFIINRVDLINTSWLDLVTLRCVCCMGNGKNNIKGHNPDVWQAFKMGKSSYEAITSLMAENTLKETTEERSVVDGDNSLARVPNGIKSGEYNSVKHRTNGRQLNDTGSEDLVSSTTDGFVTSKNGRQENMSPLTSLITTQTIYQGNPDNIAGTVIEVNDMLDHESDSIFESQVAEPSGEIVEVKLDEPEEDVTIDNSGQKSPNKSVKEASCERYSADGVKYEINLVSETTEETCQYSDIKISDDEKFQALHIGRPRGRPGKLNPALVCKNSVERSFKRGSQSMWPGDYIIPDIGELHKQIRSKNIIICDASKSEEFFSNETGLISDGLGLTQKHSRMAQLLAANAERLDKEHPTISRKKKSMTVNEKKAPGRQYLQKEEKHSAVLAKVSVGKEKNDKPNRSENTRELKSAAENKNAITEFERNEHYGLVISENDIHKTGLAVNSKHTRDKNIDNFKENSVIVEKEDKWKSPEMNKIVGKNKGTATNEMCQTVQENTPKANLEETSLKEITLNDFEVDCDRGTGHISRTSNREGQVALTQKNLAANIKVDFSVLGNSKKDRSDACRQALTTDRSMVKQSDTEACINVNLNTTHSINDQTSMVEPPDTEACNDVNLNTKHSINDQTSLVEKAEAEGCIDVNINTKHSINNQTTLIKEADIETYKEVCVDQNFQVDRSSSAPKSPLKTLIYSQNSPSAITPPSRRVERLCTQLASLEKLNRPDLSLQALATIATAENESESDTEQEQTDASKSVIEQPDDQSDLSKITNKEQVSKIALNLDNILPEKQKHTKLESVLVKLMKTSAFSFDKQLGIITMKSLNKTAAKFFPGLFASGAEKMMTKLGVLMSLYASKKYHLHKARKFLSDEQRAQEETEVNNNDVIVSTDIETADLDTRGNTQASGEDKQDIVIHSDENVYTQNSDLNSEENLNHSDGDSQCIDMDVDNTINAQDSDMSINEELGDVENKEAVVNTVVKSSQNFVESFDNTGVNSEKNNYTTLPAKEFIAEAGKTATKSSQNEGANIAKGQCRKPVVVLTRLKIPDKDCISVMNEIYRDVSVLGNERLVSRQKLQSVSSCMTKDNNIILESNNELPKTIDSEPLTRVRKSEQSKSPVRVASKSPVRITRKSSVSSNMTKDNTLESNDELPNAIDIEPLARGRKSKLDKSPVRVASKSPVRITCISSVSSNMTKDNTLESNDELPNAIDIEPLARGRKSKLDKSPVRIASKSPATITCRSPNSSRMTKDNISESNDELPNATDSEPRARGRKSKECKSPVRIGSESSVRRASKSPVRIASKLSVSSQIAKDNALESNDKLPNAICCEPLARGTKSKECKSPKRMASKSPVNIASKSPKPMKSPVRKAAPVRKASNSPSRKASKSAVGKESKSPKKIKSPVSKAIKSPASKAFNSSVTNSSPSRKASKSAVRKTSTSPVRTTIKSSVIKTSPSRNAIISPVRKAIKCSVIKTSLSRKASESAVRKASTSPVRKVSPVRLSSKSAVRKDGKYPVRNASNSAVRKASKPPMRKAIKSVVRKASKSAVRKARHYQLKKANNIQKPRKCPISKASNPPAIMSTKLPERKTSKLQVKKASKSPVRKASQPPVRKASQSPDLKMKTSDVNKSIDKNLESSVEKRIVIKKVVSPTDSVIVIKLQDVLPSKENDSDLAIPVLKSSGQMIKAPEASFVRDERICKKSLDVKVAGTKEQSSKRTSLKNQDNLSPDKLTKRVPQRFWELDSRDKSGRFVRVDQGSRSVLSDRETQKFSQKKRLKIEKSISASTYDNDTVSVAAVDIDGTVRTCETFKPSGSRKLSKTKENVKLKTAKTSDSYNEEMALEADEKCGPGRSKKRKQTSLDTSCDGDIENNNESYNNCEETVLVADKKHGSGRQKKRKHASQDKNSDDGIENTNESSNRCEEAGLDTGKKCESGRQKKRKQASIDKSDGNIENKKKRRKDVSKDT